MADLWQVILSKPDGQALKGWEFSTKAEAQRHYLQTDPPPLYQLSWREREPGGRLVFGHTYGPTWRELGSKVGAEEFP